MKIGTARNAVMAVSLLGFSLGIGSNALADDYIDGFEAAARGDYKKAAAVWFDLAKKGNPDAQFNLAQAYHSGVAGSYNEPEALKWYMKAANAGHQRAQEYLVVGYREGWFGLPKDQKKSHFWEAKLNP